MLTLSHHLQASFHDVRRIVNVHELRRDFHRLGSENTKSVTYHINRDTGSVKIAPDSGPFRSVSMNQFYVVMGAHMGLHRQLYEDEKVIEMVVEARRIVGGLEHPGAQRGARKKDTNYADLVGGAGSGTGDWNRWEDGTVRGSACSILCIGHENVDGGQIELELDGGRPPPILKRELSPAFLVECKDSTRFRFAPTLSFDGTHDAVQDLYIIKSHVLLC